MHYYIVRHGGNLIYTGTDFEMVKPKLPAPSIAALKGTCTSVTEIYNQKDSIVIARTPNASLAADKLYGEKEEFILPRGDITYLKEALKLL